MPDDTEGKASGRDRAKVIRALRKRVVNAEARIGELEKQHRELREKVDDTELLLLNRTAEHRIELDEITELLFGKRNEQSSGGMKATVDLHSKLWKWVPTVGGAVWTIVAGVLVAGLVAWLKLK